MKIPTNEILWTQYLNDKNEVTHIVTSDKHRDTYKLYKIDENKPVFTKHKSNDPRDLEQYIWR